MDGMSILVDLHQMEILQEEEEDYQVRLDGLQRAIADKDGVSRGAFITAKSLADIASQWPRCRSRAHGRDTRHPATPVNIIAISRCEFRILRQRHTLEHGLWAVVSARYAYPVLVRILTCSNNSRRVTDRFVHIELLLSVVRYLGE